MKAKIQRGGLRQGDNVMNVDEAKWCKEKEVKRHGRVEKVCN